MATLTIRLPKELKSDLDKISREKNKPISVLVRESLRCYVGVEQFRRIRKKILPFAESQGFFEDEDIFKRLA